MGTSCATARRTIVSPAIRNSLIMLLVLLLILCFEIALIRCRHGHLLQENSIDPPLSEYTPLPETSEDN